MECCTSVMNEVVAAVGRLATSGVVVPRDTSYVARNGLKAFTYMYEVLVQIAEKTNSAAAQPPAKVRVIPTHITFTWLSRGTGRVGHHSVA